MWKKRNLFVDKTLKEFDFGSWKMDDNNLEVDQKQNTTFKNYKKLRKPHLNCDLSETL